MQPDQRRSMSRMAERPNLSFLKGATVTRVYVDQHAAGFLLDLGPPAGTYDWCAEQSFHLRSGEEVGEPDPENPISMLPFLSTLGRSVEDADTDLDGAIRFKLSGGVVIDCASDPRYEAWQLAGPEGFLVVCLPGGGLATWSKT